MLRLLIDGREVTAEKGNTIGQAAQQAGVYIPTLCSHPLLPSYGTCGICLVKVQGREGLPTACNTPAEDGMVVWTNTPQVAEVRRRILGDILAETQHPYACLICSRKQHCRPTDTCLRNPAISEGERCVFCPKNGRCELQRVAWYIGLDRVPAPYHPKGLPIEAGEPFYDRNYNLCIVCGRCVRACDEVVGAHALAFTYHHDKPGVDAHLGCSLREAGCVFCGTCVSVCPTGALLERENQDALAETAVTTVCPYCGVGCLLNLEVKGGRIIRAVPHPQGPANHGLACVKGKFGLGFVHDARRLTHPLIKKNGQFVASTWEEALDLVAQKLAPYRGDGFAGISSAKCTNEENYLFQKFVRAVMGSNNVDHCARLCHSPSVTGLAWSFGSGAMTNTIADISQAACILAIGTNTTESHPVIGMEVYRAVRKGAKLIVANPREIPLCKAADLWLRQRPGTDVALLAGIMRVILEQGWQDEAFIARRCQDFDAFRASLADLDLERVAQITGVAGRDIFEAARLYSQHKPAAILYAMGITQHSHGTDNVKALANLAMLTGNVGKPGAGVNPLRGHNNVQGSCDAGALPDTLPGYQPVASPEARRKFEEAWGCSLRAEPGLTLTEIFNAALQGQVKALYMMGENPILSEPDASHVAEALKKLEFLVVQDIFLTESAQYAHVVLPAASFAEKDGTFTNTERRVQRVRAAVAAPGEARADWWITQEIARRMGARGFDYDDPSAIMAEMARLMPSYGGISYERLGLEGLQWPCPTPDHPGTPILHTEKFSRGLGRFSPLSYVPPQEEPDETYPLVLTTGRSLYQFHTGTLTRKVAGLNALREEELVELNPQDGAHLGLGDGERVRVVSRRGRVEARARLTGDCPRGVVFMTFHFAESPTNEVTSPALDPPSKMAELKVCAVRIEKVSRG